MPYRGSKIVPIRIPAQLLKQLDEVIARTGETCEGEPWCRTSWILKAIRDKLNHQARARRQGRKATGGQS